MRKFIGFSLFAAALLACVDAGAEICNGTPPTETTYADDCARLKVLSRDAKHYSKKFWPGKNSNGAAESMLSMKHGARDASKARSEAEQEANQVSGHPECAGVAQALGALPAPLLQSDQNYTAAEGACPTLPVSDENCWSLATAALNYDRQTVAPLAQQYAAALDAAPSSCNYAPAPGFDGNPISKLKDPLLARPRDWLRPQCSALGTQRLADIVSGLKNPTLKALATAPGSLLQSAAGDVAALAQDPTQDNAIGLRADVYYVAAQPQFEQLKTANCPADNGN